MTAPRPRFPDSQALSLGLNAVMGGDGTTGDRITILERHPAIWASTYPSEIVTCRRGGHEELKLYCKYMAGLNDHSYGHRGGLAYEIEVYQHVLHTLPLSLPKFWGAYEDRTSGDMWLILEYLDESLRVTKGPQPETIVRAADWIGRFHAVNETRVSLQEASFLNVYDPEYYLGWARRTLAFASSLRQDFPWLRTLSERFEQSLDILLSSPRTIIHGEYYPHNVLVSEGRIYPIDWESAAIAIGEIDLATLTEAWTQDTARQCALEYQRARWGGKSPADFARRFAAARLYLCFRWLGDQPEWTLGNGNRFYFEQLRSAGEALELI